LKTIYFTVTNDLNYDQRMIRICGSLAAAGYKVFLVGRSMAGSLPLVPRPFEQKRISCWFNKGFGFYAEYNIRLLWVLIFRKMDLICAIDLDTILPCYVISTLRSKRRVYDAHELFCEMKEISTRPGIYRFWKMIERIFVPRFSAGYTVNQIIADEFQKMYGVKYEVIRNVPIQSCEVSNSQNEKFILYQGAVNEGRSFETLIPAMQNVSARLIICGDGNFMPQLNQLIAFYGLDQKITVKGKLLPEELKKLTPQAYLGVTLFDNSGLSNYYSLSNRFFDYVNAGIPQLCVDYPAYREINEQFEVSLLIRDLSPENIALSLNNLLKDEVLYKKLRQNCGMAAKLFNWENEEKKLLAFYQKLMN
jgi:glycosyltransferase involved in cell wall biosynthesis